MAGEWIPIDCNLGTKPEVLELMEETGQPLEVVGWRLVQLWSWAALNSSDGTIRATPRRIAAVAGGDEAFWLAVERVGWVSFGDGTVKISGWERRFSRAAKARNAAALRACAFRARKALPQYSTVQERTEEQPSVVAPTDSPKRRNRSQPADPIRWTPAAGWEGITPEDRAAWGTAYPACDIPGELARMSEWLRANPAKAHKSRWRAFVTAWLTRSQDKGGGKPSNRPGDAAPAKAWADRPSWRADAGRNMTDTQHRAWRASQRRDAPADALAVASSLSAHLDGSPYP
jgi:hypothetical protein